MAADSDFLKYNEAQELQDFQYDGVDYLYNLPPQQNNLFMVAKFYDPYRNLTESSDVDAYAVTNAKIPDKMEYRIKSISGIKLPALNIDSSSLGTAFRWNYVSSNKSTDNQLSINWMEDVFWTVRRYHMNWMNSWYNKALDCMIVGQNGKFRNLVMYSFRYKNLNESTAVPVQKAVPVARFEFKGLVPKNAGGEVNFDWAESGSGAALKVDYTFNHLEVYFYPYTKEEKNFLGGMAMFVQDAKSYENTNIKDTFNTNITGYTDSLKGLNPEGQFKGVKNLAPASIYYI